MLNTIQYNSNFISNFETHNNFLITPNSLMCSCKAPKQVQKQWPSEQWPDMQYLPKERKPDALYLPLLLIKLDVPLSCLFKIVGHYTDRLQTDWYHSIGFPWQKLMTGQRRVQTKIRLHVSVVWSWSTLSTKEIHNHEWHDKDWLFKKCFNDLED